MIVSPKLHFDRSQFCDLRGVHLRFTIEQIDVGDAPVVIDDTTTFENDDFRRRLLHSGCIDLSNKEALRGREPLRFDFRGFDFRGYDLFQSSLETCIFDSVTSFEGAYVCDTTVPPTVDLRALGAVIFGQGSLSLHGATVTADLDLSSVSTLSGSSLLGMDLSLSDAGLAAARKAMRSSLVTSYRHCLFNDQTKFPETLRDSNGDVDDYTALVADCDYIESDSGLRLRVLSGEDVSAIGALPVRDMPLVPNMPLPQSMFDEATEVLRIPVTGVNSVTVLSDAVKLALSDEVQVKQECLAHHEQTGHGIAHHHIKRPLERLRVWKLFN